MSPKPKPDEVIRHEIVLGRKEFELLENSLIYPSIIGGVRDLLPYVKDAATAIALVEGIATALELMGIPTPIPTPVDLARWIEENGWIPTDAEVEAAVDTAQQAGTILGGAGITAVSPLAGLIYAIANWQQLVAGSPLDFSDIDFSSYSPFDTEEGPKV